MDGIRVEHVDIPINSESIVLKGSIYSNSNTPVKSPFIIVSTGLLGNRSSFFPLFFIETFVNAGYYVLCYDHRCHGETAKQTGRNWIKNLPKIFNDIHEVITYVLDSQQDKLLNNKVFLFGRSFAGAMLLTQGYADDRASKIIALCTRHDYRTIKVRFPDYCIDIMSCKNYIKKDLKNNNRILLAHCKDDKEIDFFNILRIKEQMDLNDENVIIYESGGHHFKGHREELASRILEFLKKL